MKAIFILEGILDESHQSELSKAVDVLAKDFGLESYLDDVIEDDIIRKCEGRISENNKDGEQCKHSNSWASNCSDCDEENTSTNGT